MTNYLIEDAFEFEGLSEIIPLESQYTDQALNVSDRVSQESRKWSAYLQALALFSWQEWLRKREPHLPIDYQKCSVFQPKYTNVLDAVSNLDFGKFQLCLIPTLGFSGEEVIIPRTVVDLPEYVAHFYVFIGIEEELEIASIRGFLSYTQLRKCIENIQPDIDWNYPLPTTLINSEADKLLFELSCSESASIPLPKKPNRQHILAQQKSALETALTKINNRPLWKVLTWQQAEAVLTNSDLINWLYETSTGNTEVLNRYLSDLLKILTMQAVNVGLWWQNQMHGLVEELSWQPLIASSFRGESEPSPVQSLDGILLEINKTTGLKVPDVAGRAYQDLPLEIPLRLYALTWSVSEVDKEWALLLILGAVPGNTPPYGVKLRVSDQTGILLEEELSTNSNDGYLFTQVEGSYAEKFLATITPANRGTPISRLFEFKPDT